MNDLLVTTLLVLGIVLGIIGGMLRDHTHDQRLDELERIQQEMLAREGGEE